MKRRDFLRASATLGGAMLPASLAWSQGRPCPPPGLSVRGGTETTSNCVAPAGRLADWEARANAPGVVWAHRFDSPGAPGLYWGQTVAGNTLGRRCGFISEELPFDGRADGGIIGDGCMEIYVPPDVSSGAISWGRPLAPTTGPMHVPLTGFVASSTAPDVNRAGLRLMNFRRFYSAYAGDPEGKKGNGGGGFFSNPADLETYQRIIPAGRSNDEDEEIYYAGADGFYIQYRVKFKTLPNGDNRLDYVDPPSEGKHWNLSNMVDSAPISQIVAIIRPHLDNVWGLFGAVGYWWFSEQQTNLTTYQPGYRTGATCGPKDRSDCWKFRKDKWITILVHIVPGRQNPGKLEGTGWNPEWVRDQAKYRDAGIEVWAADEDEIAAGQGYTKIFSALNRYAVHYDADYQGRHFPLSGTRQAPGYNHFEFYPYTNPKTGAAIAYPKANWVLYDQVICSTGFIPCPLV